MTRIEYCEECGTIGEITSGGVGGVDLMDTPTKENVLETMDVLELERVSEVDIALITMASYEGRLDEYDLCATGASYMATDDDRDPIPCPGDDCEHPYLTQFILMVEMVDEEERMLALTCPECGFEPGESSDWDFAVVERDWCTEHQFRCPDCTYEEGPEEGQSPIVWSEHFDMDDEMFDTPASDYDHYLERE